MITFNDIVTIKTATDKAGYEIIFNTNDVIWVIKRRALVGLLLLLKYEVCSEADLVGANNRLQEIKKELQNKIEDINWIQDRYGDANKPFSELWTEEGFSCVHAEGMKGNRQYVLRPDDRNLLFNNNIKTQRIQLSKNDKNKILEIQSNRCNICGAEFKVPQEHSFAKDRIKCEFDHRIPVDHGGENNINNIQALCHYCNKCKRQMCFVCKETKCSVKCALVYPEKETIVIATHEDISDRITNRHQ